MYYIFIKLNTYFFMFTAGLSIHLDFLTPILNFTTCSILNNLSVTDFLNLLLLCQLSIHIFTGFAPRYFGLCLLFHCYPKRFIFLLFSLCGLPNHFLLCLLIKLIIGAKFIISYSSLLNLLR